MYETFWGLAESPFQNSVDRRWYYESPMHEEALARLFFLIEHRRRCAILTGAAGTGKSLMLNILTEQLRRTQRHMAVIDLLGLSAHELLWQSAVALNATPCGSDSSWHIWRSLHDHLTGLQQSRLQTVVILDHFDRAETDCVRVLERLMHLDNGPVCWMTLIIVTQNIEGSLASSELADWSDLRIELSSLNRDETACYVNELMQKAGCHRDVFDSQALDTLFERTNGIPRRINRLCDLSLLAAMGEGRDTVDRSVLSMACAELPSRFEVHDTLPPLPDFVRHSVH